VTAIKFLPQPEGKAPILLSGSVDKKICVWRGSLASPFGFRRVAVLEGHTGSINCLAVVASSKVFLSGAADATVRVWQLDFSNGAITAELLQTVQLQPRYFPLAVALSPLSPSGALAFAVGGTKSIVQIYVADSGGIDVNFTLRATLTGHEGWIRSLDFIHEGKGEETDLLLASASQDKYIRLWRLHQGLDVPALTSSAQDPSLGMSGKSLSNKAHRFDTSGDKYTLTFEALLLGHEDWIYTAKWNRNEENLQLLSVSADNSLAIWESDVNSGVWICTTRLGEISAQKGSTTATGSAGGFWIGLWSPDGRSVASLGKTGSWRLWTHDRDRDRWVQGLGISGHVRDVKGIAWAKDGSYLLSTSSDQTTRLHAEWRRHGKRSWHEFARPQIHGYDLNCIDSLGQSQFISGADEKLLRVFDEPGAVAKMLQNLCGISSKPVQDMPEAANIPVLGLSNKAVEVIEETETLGIGEVDERDAPDPASTAQKPNFHIEHPPLEDLLSRHTLWPEREKLYGHGYEISAVAASQDGTLVATSCKASSPDHAVIRMYETSGWHEIKPPLKAHSLTLTCLRFAADDKMLLSVSRDRQWTVFERDSDTEIYALKESHPKGHSRMVLGAAWAPLIARRGFVTAGRDKFVRVWVAETDRFQLKVSIEAQSSVTSVEFLQRGCGNSIVLAAGTENGDVLLYSFNSSTLDLQATRAVDREYVDHFYIC
jgi:elongator complex protein 2